MKMKNVLLLLLLGLFFALESMAVSFDFKSEDLAKILRIAKSIKKVQPYLSHSKYIEFAHAIHEASKQYDIDPKLLISIAQQESSFRDSLPEGPAGELGICQIRKDWLNNARFRNEFKHASEKRLRRANYSFKYAAWILKNLRQDVVDHPLPYWTYYNSPSRTHQLIYYLAIQKHFRQMGA